jgi:radical SAM protein (TIGR01212 family)
LEEILDRVSQFEGAVMIDIATRADCLDRGIIEVLHKVSGKIPVTVELGLQSANDKTARLINRGHDFDTFVRGFQALRGGAPNVKIGVHIINGLPGENREIMKKTAESVAKLHPDLVKIHLLHVLEGTVLGQMYKTGEYIPLEKDEYVSIVCDQLELFPPEAVIERVTGDGARDSLLAPLWSLKKVAVINDIDKEMYRRGSYQGIKCKAFDKV